MTKTFGGGSPRDNECDMVDIGNMANQLSDLFPQEAAAVLAQLEKAVVYNRHNSNVHLYGLSAYYIYDGKEFGDSSMKTYASLDMNEAYTGYLDNFYRMLVSKNTANNNRSLRQPDNSADSPGDILHTELTLWQPLAHDNADGKYIMVGLQSEPDKITDEAAVADTGLNTRWPAINGRYVCLHKINSSENGSLYAIPSVRNGSDCDILILFNEKYPDGKILGTRQEDGVIIQKGFEEIIEGDKIAFYYQEKTFDGHNSDDVRWHQSDAFTAKGDLKLEWLTPEKGEYYYSLLYTDILQNKHFSDITPKIPII
jgi:hypothetical protein